MGLVKYNNNSISDVTALDSIASGSLVLIKTQTFSNVSNISFIHGSSDVVFDSTYDSYMFSFINVHVDTDETEFGFNFTTDGTNFNVTKTTTIWDMYHNEAGSELSLEYDGLGNDLAQGTGYQFGTDKVPNDADMCCTGHLNIYSPANTTFVKHFTSRQMQNRANGSNYSIYDLHIAGYGNTTSAITGVDFKAASGTIDGTIKLYGISKS